VRPTLPWWKDERVSKWIQTVEKLECDLLDGDVAAVLIYGDEEYRCGGVLHALSLLAALVLTQHSVLVWKK
jgi:hypothetical protein